MSNDEELRDALHVLNGDAMKPAWAQAGIPGEPLVWREIYTAGPLAADWRSPEVRSVRADWLAQHYGIPQGEYVSGCERQERVWDETRRDRRPIVLWSDPDLFDQAILMALCRNDRNAQLWLAAVPAGMLGEDEMNRCWEGRRKLSPAEKETAAHGWEAFAHGSREAAADWLQSADAETLPELMAAMKVHLERFSGEDGLGIAERVVLAEAAAGGEDGVTLFQLFGRVSRELPLFGLGDLQMWRIVENLARSGPALLELRNSAGEQVLSLPKFGEDPAPVRDIAVRLTAAGEELTAGRRTAPPGAAELQDA